MQLKVVKVVITTSEWISSPISGG